MEEQERYEIEPRATWRRCAGRFTGPGGGEPNASAHYRKHVLVQREWSQEQLDLRTYVARARDHLDRDDVYEFVDLDSRAVAKFDLISGELGIANYDDGHIRTFFRPEDGPPYVERRLRRGEWIPHALLGHAVDPREANIDDPVAREARDQIEALLTGLRTREVAALEVARLWLDVPGQISLGPVVDLVTHVEQLRAMALYVERTASTDGLEELARELAGHLNEWAGVVEGLDEVLGAGITAAIGHRTEELLSRLEAVAYDRRGAALEEHENTWTFRDQVELLMASIAARVSDAPEGVERFLALRLRVEIVDRRLRRLCVASPPEFREWEPLWWAWWRQGKAR